MESSTEQTPKHTPRLHNPAHGAMIRSHAARVQVLERAHLLPADWRSSLERYVADHLIARCQHVTRTFIEVEGQHGKWGVEICDDCGVQVARECPHATMIWCADGTALICTNCGHDGT